MNIKKETAAIVFHLWHDQVISHQLVYKVSLYKKTMHLSRDSTKLYTVLYTAKSSPLFYLPLSPSSESEF